MSCITFISILIYYFHFNDKTEHVHMLTLISTKYNVRFSPSGIDMGAPDIKQNDGYVPCSSICNLLFYHW